VKTILDEAFQSVNVYLKEFNQYLLVFFIGVMSGVLGKPIDRPIALRASQTVATHRSVYLSARSANLPIGNVIRTDSVAGRYRHVAGRHNQFEKQDQTLCGPDCGLVEE